jgi:hypothetical protein
MMSVASFVVTPIKDGWGVNHADETAGPYLTREAAFEAAIGPASNAIKNGDEVRIVVKAPVSGSALGPE